MCAYDQRDEVRTMRLLPVVSVAAMGKIKQDDEKEGAFRTNRRVGYTSPNGNGAQPTLARFGRRIWARCEGKLMRKRVVIWLALVGAAAGCSKPPAPAEDQNEGEVKAAFVQFQAAMKKGDGVALWELVDEDTRQDADRAAKVAQMQFEKGNDADKAALAKKLGLADADLKGIKGAGFLGSKLFMDKYREIPTGQAEKVEFPRKGTAKLTYFDPTDNDREDVALVREQGKWKLRLKGMPRLEN